MNSDEATSLVVRPADRPHPYAKALLKSYGPKTERAYRNALRGVLSLVMEIPISDIPDYGPEVADWHALTPSMARVIKAKLKGRYSPRTVNLALAAIRAMFGSAFDEGLISAEAYYRMIRPKGPLSNLKFRKLPVGRYISNREKGKLYRALRNRGRKYPKFYPASVRNASMLAIGFSHGPRVSEMVGIDLSDYQRETGMVTIRYGKGDKERQDRLHPAARRPLIDWLEIRGEEPGPLFVPVNKAGEVQVRTMSTQAVEYLCGRLSKWAKIPPFTWHDIRRTAGSDLIENSDLSIAGEILGHADKNTTALYDRRPESKRYDAIAQIGIPYNNGD